MVSRSWSRSLRAACICPIRSALCSPARRSPPPAAEVGIALTRDLIFDVVLPPLLFEAALNLRWSDLRRDLFPVVALSTLGVALSATVVAGGLVYGLGWSVEFALIFGALIAATDPIAVIALLRESGVTGRLRLLIEAESLVNDGAAAVLFN